MNNAKIIAVDFDEVATAPEWDGHTDKDVERVLSLSDDESDWAAREVALASQKEREGAENKDDLDYGVMCYESALRAYRSLERDGHSGMSIQIKIIVEEFLTDEKNGDFDTVGYLQLILPNGEVVDLNGYFKDCPDGMVRIEQAEYEERKARRIDKK